MADLARPAQKTSPLIAAPGYMFLTGLVYSPIKPGRTAESL
jgi:hypothetical protein